jgi:hypothetical protein
VVPAEPSLPRVKSFTWGEFSGASDHTEWSFDDGELDLLVYGPGVAGPDGLAKMFGVLNQSGEFVFDTGDKLEARFVHVWSSDTSINVERKQAITTHALRLDSWTWHPRNVESLWLGILEGAVVDYSNLVLHGKKWWSAKHLRLRGTYDLYVVKTKPGPVALVVDTGGRRLDHEVLGTDILALEFVMGRPLHLNYLTALGPDEAVVGAAGLGFARSRPRHCNRRCPVAGERELYFIADETIAEHLWVPVLFELVAKRLQAEGQDSPLLTAIAAYLDSLTGHIHANYLLAQVALEAFCAGVVEATSGVLVKNPKAWVGFVEQKRTDFLAHAIDEEAGRKLVNKVINAQNAPSTDRVATALTHFGLTVPQQALREVARRNTAAHRYVMAQESTADPEELADRVAIVQTLLVAVIAKYIGFSGPIVGWEWAHGRRTIPAWWPWERLSQARRRYMVLDPAINTEDGPATETEPSQ